MEGGNIPDVVIVLLFFPDEFGFPDFSGLIPGQLLPILPYQGRPSPWQLWRNSPPLSHLHLLYPPVFNARQGL